MTLSFTFEQVFRDACSILAEGAVNRSVAAHTPVVGTDDGDLRVMVLRSFDPDVMSLRFHTDLRAPKCAVIADRPSMNVLVYDRDRKVQLRLSGQGQIVAAGHEVDEAWSASSPFARRCYLGDAPGTRSPIPTSGLPAEVEGIAPTELQLKAARANFALLTVTLDTIDWFFLDHHGHKRALLDMHDRTADRWLTP